MSLPDGTRLTIGADVWRHDGGRTLVGGAPLKVMRLSSRALALLGDADTVTLADAGSRALGERLLAAGIAHPQLDSLPAIDQGQLTVVIPVHGRARQLDRLLAGLCGDAGGDGAGARPTVIVVDDGTPHPLADALRQTALRHGATLVRLDENIGPASARNAGLARAATPFVAFVDSDVVVTADDLALLLRHFADPGLAVVAPRIVGVAEPGAPWFTRYENSRSSIDLGTGSALVRPRSRVSWLSSTCLVARRAAIEDGFTPGMRVAEDVDLVWRLAGTAWRVRYEPAVAVAHEHRTTLRAWLARKVFYGTGAADLAPRHPRFIPPAILRPWSLALLIALFAARRWSLPVAGAIALFEAWRLSRRTRAVTGSWVLPLRLTGGGIVSALTQASALALRHWWPVGVVAAVVSRRARWIIGAMAVVDGLVEHRRVGSDLDPVRFTIARRLDDLAYGTGVWLGCLRRRSFAALRPEIAPERASERE